MMDERTYLQLNTNSIIKSIVNFIVPLVCLLVCIILGFFIIFPYYKNKPAVDAQIADKQALNQLLEGKLVILNKLTDFKNILAENSQLVDKVLVSEANVPQLLDEIYQIATSVGLSVTRLNYSYGDARTAANSAPNQFSEVNVSLGAGGTYDQLTTFLQDTEVAARVLYVPSLRYSVDSEGAMSMNFNVVSPFLYVQSTAVTDDPVELDITSSSFTNFMNKLKTMKFYEFLNKDIGVIGGSEPAATP
jgi:Tfp pilus assembly protein PilO